MTASATETVILALVAALVVKSAESSPKIPTPLRNQDIVTRMVAVITDAKLSLYLNVLDGEAVFGDGDELLAADLGNTEAYERDQHVSIEWAVAGGATDDARETAFDEGRRAIWDALKPALTSGSPVYLGGAVGGVRLISILNKESTSVDGLPNIKACVFVLALSFTSVDPF